MPEISESQLALIYGTLAGLRTRLKNTTHSSLHENKKGIDEVLKGLQSNFENFDIIKELKEKYGVK